MIRQTLYSIAYLCAFTLCGVMLSSFTQNNAAEVGKCGIYADSFHGRTTASGEKYNKDALTCSHKTLAFGTKVRVTRLDNKKSVVVRVNDRGPFIEGYVVDVSGAAAKELDIVKTGSAKVKVEVVETAESSLASDAQAEADAVAAKQTTQTQPAATTAAKPASYSNTTAVNTTPKGVAATGAAATGPQSAPTSNLYKIDITQSEKKGFGIQIASLNDANGVLPFMNELQTKYAGKVLVNVLRDEFNNPTYKVIVGPFADKKSAESTQKTIAQKYKKTMVVDLSGM